MVCETDTARLGKACISALAKLDLPAPEGAESINNLPDIVVDQKLKWVQPPDPGLFDILHLLTHLLDQHFEIDGGIGQAQIGRFGT